MSNEIARREHPSQKAEITTGGTISALVPKSIDETFRMSQALARAGDMVPRHYQDKPDAIMAAMIRGMEVGLAPMQALANIAVINGRASLWGDALPALMQRAGHHVDVEIDGDWDKGDAVATATLTRGDTGKVIVRRFSQGDAKRANLAGKQGPWTQYPTRMLAHRARSWAIRDGAADALMGMQIADEMSDIGPDRARDVTPKARSGSTTFIPAGQEAPREPEPDPQEVDEIHDAEVINGEDEGYPEYQGQPDTTPTLTDEERDRLAAEARGDSDRMAAE